LSIRLETAPRSAPKESIRNLIGRRLKVGNNKGRVSSLVPNLSSERMEDVLDGANLLFHGKKKR
jgi:hypothetical protein